MSFDSNELATLANSDIGQHAIKEGMEFLTRLGGAVVQETAGWITPEVRTTLALRQIELALKVQKKLNDSGLPMNAVKWNLLYPLLNAAALQDPAEQGGEEMHERWANLLANASASQSVPTAFVGILSDLSHEDAQMFDRLVDECASKSFDYDYAQAIFREIGRPHGIDFGSRFHASLDNLLRLGILGSNFRALYDRNEDSPGLSKVHLTETYFVNELGLRFHKACSSPQKR